jgi:hypothetical protein
MIKRNIWALTLMITLSSQIYGQAYRGYGGYMLGLWSIDWGKLNNQITDLNIDNFGIGNLENALMMNGGGGAVNVYNNLFIGGMGFSGSTHINGADANSINRDITISSTLAGPYVESNYNPYGNIEINFGVALLFGNANIRVLKDSGTNSWTNIWSSFNDANPSYLNTQASTDITVINPFMSLRYPLMPWFGFDLSLGYNLTLYDSNGWEANNAPLAGKQELELSKPFFRIALILGG